MNLELTDVLKGDLARLWLNQIPDLDPSFSSPANCGSLKIETADIDDNVYEFIVRLHYFFADALKSSSPSSSKTRDSLHVFFS